MSFAVNQNFDLKSRIKDFTRQELKLTDLPNTRDADYPDDYLVTIDGKIYIFNSANELDPTTGKWREFKAGADTINWDNVTNKPEILEADEEDLTKSGDSLKFKDRAYDADNFSGKGYKILRKNI
jgi:hypothetical protein